MRRLNIVYISILCFSVTACVTPFPEQSQSGGTVIGRPATGTATKGPSSVLGCDNLVKISAQNTDEGIARQNSWIAKNYPKSQKVRQRLSECAGRKVEVITVETQNGAREDIYFDVSSYFNKANKDLDDLLDG